MTTSTWSHGGQTTMRDITHSMKPMITPHMSTPLVMVGSVVQFLLGGTKTKKNWT